LSADLREDLQPTAFREREVEQHKIGVCAVDEEEGLLARAGNGCLISSSRQTGGESGGHFSVVFDDQYPTELRRCFQMTLHDDDFLGWWSPQESRRECKEDVSQA
jgi:hypothetical protein